MDDSRFAFVVQPQRAHRTFRARLAEYAQTAAYFFILIAVVAGNGLVLFFPAVGIERDDGAAFAFGIGPTVP